MHGVMYTEYIEGDASFAFGCDVSSGDGDHFRKAETSARQQVYRIYGRQCKFYMCARCEFRWRGPFSQSEAKGMATRIQDISKVMLALHLYAL